MKSIEIEGKTVDDAINKAVEQLQSSRDQVAVEILAEGSRGLFGLMGTRPARVRVSMGAGLNVPVNKVEPQNKPKQEISERREVKSKEAKSKEQEISERKEAKSKEAKSKEAKSKEAKSKEQEISERKEAKSKEAKSNEKVVYDEKNVQRIVATAKQALEVILERLQIEYTVEVKQRDDQILLNIHCDNENFLIGRRGTTLDAIQYLVNRIANKQTEEKIQVVLDTSNYRVNRKQRLQRLALRLSRKVKMTGKPVTIAPMNPHDRRIIHLTLQDDSSVKTLSRGNGFMRRVIISSNRNRNSSRKRNK